MNPSTPYAGTWLSRTIMGSANPTYDGTSQVVFGKAATGVIGFGRMNTSSITTIQRSQLNAAVTSGQPTVIGGITFTVRGYASNYLVQYSGPFSSGSIWYDPSRNRFVWNTSLDRSRSYLLVPTSAGQAAGRLHDMGTFFGGSSLLWGIASLVLGIAGMFVGVSEAVIAAGAVGEAGVTITSILTTGNIIATAGVFAGTVGTIGGVMDAAGATPSWESNQSGASVEPSPLPAPSGYGLPSSDTGGFGTGGDGSGVSNVTMDFPIPTE